MSFFIKLYSLCKQKRQFAYFFAILLAVSVLMSNGLIVQAADFKHNHTSSCYRTGEGPCTASHSSYTSTSSTTRHCFNCNAQKDHTTRVYWDKCYGTGVAYELGGTHNCKTCGATSYAWGGTSAGTHMVTRQILSCGKSNDATGTLWIKNAVTDWTTESVTLEAGVTIHNSSLTLASQPYSWDNQASWSSETTKQITENGIYTIFAKSSDGTVIGENVAVTNIDQTGPTLKSVERSTSDWTNQDVTLTFFAEDLQPEGSGGCGLADMPYSYDGGETHVAENCLTVSGNGIYEVQLMDALGNIGMAQVEVNNIDKEVPVISDITQVNEGWQSQTVIMKVCAQDSEGGSGLHEMPYSIDGENWQSEPEFLFNTNGIYTIYVRDAIGNGITQKFDVNHIDVTAPVIESIQALPDKIWSDRVEVIVNAKDLQPDGSVGSGLNEIAYSIDGGQTWQESNIFLVEEGTTYDVRVRDALLWESEEYCLVREDLPYPPPVVDNSSDSSHNPTPPVVQPETEPGEDNLEEIITEEELSDDSDMESDEERAQSYTNWDAGKAAAMEGLYAFGNFYGQKQQSDISEVEQIMEQTVEFKENADANTQTVQVIKMPWYTTVVGKTVIVSTSTLALGSLLGIAVYLLVFSAVVYCVEDTKKIHKLGRVLIHRTKEGYSVFLSDILLKTSGVPKYRIKINTILVKRVKNARLLVESSEKNLEVLMQESIDFEL